MRFPAMPRAVPWVFLALVVLTLSAVTAWPWRSTRTTRPSSRSSSRPSTTTSSSPPVAQEQPDGSLLLPWRTKPGPNAHFHKVNRMSVYFCVVFDTFRYMSHPTRTVMRVFQCFHASERGQTRLLPGCLGFDQVFLHIHACITPRVSCRRDLADGIARRFPLCAGQEALANDHQEVRRRDRGRVG
jgi:hypothetical protein